MPGITQTYGKLVSPDFQRVLDNLRLVFGADLRFSHVDKDSAICHSYSLVDKKLMDAMETEKENIFGSDLWRFQILCAEHDSPGKGVEINFLEDMRKRGEYRHGFWFK